MMKVKRLLTEQMSVREFAQFAEAERAGRDAFAELDQLRKMLELQQTYACFDGDRLAAYLVLDRMHPYCGGSIHIAEMKPSWDCFTNEVLCFLIRQSVIACTPTDRERYVTVDVHRKRCLLDSVYNSLGFRACCMNSVVDADHVVLMTSVKALCNTSGAGKGE